MITRFTRGDAELLKPAHTEKIAYLPAHEKQRKYLREVIGTKGKDYRNGTNKA